MFWPPGWIWIPILGFAPIKLIHHTAFAPLSLLSTCYNLVHLQFILWSLLHFYVPLLTAYICSFAHRALERNQRVPSFNFQRRTTLKLCPWQQPLFFVVVHKLSSKLSPSSKLHVSFECSVSLSSSELAQWVSQSLCQSMSYKVRSMRSFASYNSWNKCSFLQHCFEILMKYPNL